MEGGGFDGRLLLPGQRSMEDMGKIPRKKSKRLEEEQRSLLLHPEEEDECNGQAYKANSWEWRYLERPERRQGDISS
ncbi:hypothetical protein M0R45_014724 [Rubus argutus]|uniref:Uncharacterized protein n=1 Tax=Rubus argutus TaxID=59490 RepID=A0AAW1XNS9_RUBAR